MDDLHHSLKLALLDDPDDQATLMVYSDWLQSRGDPRGDLIALHGAQDGERDPMRIAALQKAEKELFSRHGPRLAPVQLHGQVEHRATWRHGFIRTLFLRLEGNLSDADLLRQVLSHPALWCLTELQLDLAATGHEPALGALSEVAPPALRTLELGRGAYGAVPGARLAGIEALPRLERLVLHEGIHWRCPAHGRLRWLELGAGSTMLWDGARRHPRPEPVPETLEALDRDRLPALRGLRVSGLGDRLRAPLVRLFLRPGLPPLEELHLDRCGDIDGACAALASSPLRTSLARLTLSDSMTLSGARALAEMRCPDLERLDVSGNRLENHARSILEPLCRELVFGWQQRGGGGDTDLARDAWFVRHTRRPDWGVGRVVEQLEDGLVIVFQNVGHKTVPATLPALESVPEGRVPVDSPLRSLDPCPGRSG